MTVKNSGRRRAGDSYRSINSTQGAVSTGYQTYSYISPQVTLECEKLTDEEISRLSGEVKVYKIDDFKKKGERK
ncbi:hypothetical protein ABWK43_05400 [Bacillus thuringiensis]|uniref:hypothetical protein n=1 Tax=Bacillus thuringiensis TaxID=1428 RepID=UPI0033982AB7